MASVSDNFNRSDTTVMTPNWAEDSGDWDVYLNRANQNTTGGSYRKLRWAGAALSSNDYQIEIDGITGGSSEGIGAFGRGAVSAAVTYYGAIVFSGDKFYLIEITNGGESVIASGSSASSGIPYNIKLKCNGSSLTVYRNGVSDIVGSDSTLASGAVGILSYGIVSDSYYADNFAASDLAGETPVKVPKHAPRPISADQRRIFAGML